jgi:hypothetical protein
MMNYPVPQDYRDFLQSRLNPFERFTDLLSGRDDRQDYTNILLFYLLQAITGWTPGSGGGGTEPPPGSSLVFPELGMISEECMTNIAAVTTNIINPQKMVDCRKSHRVLLAINNGFNQAIQVAVIGNLSNNYSSAKTIYTFNVDAGGSGAYGFKFEDWMPYVACQVTPLVAPTGGVINAAVIKQEAIAV